MVYSYYVTPRSPSSEQLLRSASSRLQECEAILARMAARDRLAKTEMNRCRQALEHSRAALNAFSPWLDAS